VRPRRRARPRRALSKHRVSVNGLPDPPHGLTKTLIIITVSHRKILKSLAFACARVLRAPARAFVDAKLLVPHVHFSTTAISRRVSGFAFLQRSQVHDAFAEGLEPMIALLAESAPGTSKAARRRKAVAAMSGLVGALLLARAIGKRELSDEILEATRRELLEGTGR
jgi:hypothetical protein